jgi:NAD(P)-dependent dehydrogenase (short-subunit alcohol dehydrogenase family)
MIINQMTFVHRSAVNAVAPGLIDTSLGKLLVSCVSVGSDQIMIIFLRDFLVRNPNDERVGGPISAAKLGLGLTVDAPHGQVEDVSSLVSYLAKPESHFINGMS